MEIQMPLDALLRALLALHPRRRLSILDSCGARGPAARFLIAGFDPLETIEAHGTRLRLENHVAGSVHIVQGDALTLLEDRLKKYSAAPEAAADAPALAGGACIATFSYDLARGLERLRLAPRARRSTDEPDAVFAFYDTLLIHDYEEGTTRIESIAGPPRVEASYRAIAARMENHERQAGPACEAGPLDETGPGYDAGPEFETGPDDEAGAEYAVGPSSAVSNMTRDEYLAAIRLIKEHIGAGDIYQANLTQQFSCELAGRIGPESVFLRLRRDHPASFAAFLRRREDVVISASPERFLRVCLKGSERVVEAWPIKGTRARGLDAFADCALRAELLRSEKDRAENVMIVDLLRNDLGRVCRYGSVSVSELCAIEEHPTLFHLVSKVKGTLREEVGVGQLLRAAFPCGSVTGAPKIRAMEIIDEVETVPRGLSMGALGYFGCDGSLDLNVAIRTMTLRQGSVRFNVGGGIVADSEPLMEYEESLLKARALFNALGVRPALA
jgi:para-aminobenzoate synthetase component 1